MTGKSDDGRPLVFYLLGVTHNGLVVEYDDYFARIVVPAFQEASVYAYEKAVIDPQGIPECGTDIATDAHRDAVKHLRKRVAGLFAQFQKAVNAKTGFDARMSTPVYRTMGEVYANWLAEFGLIEALGAYRALLISLDDPPTPAGPVKMVARALADMRPELESSSLDSPSDLTAAYCNLGESRTAYLQSAIEHDELVENSHGEGATAYEVEEASRDFGMSLTDQAVRGVFMQPEAFDRAFVCGRNDVWIERMLHPPRTGTAFYAVGLAHLFAPRGGGCGGLLTTLTDANFRVVLVPGP